MFEKFDNINWFLLREKLRHIKLVATDIDGVLTDGFIYISDDGIQMRKFNVKDGLGIKLLQYFGIEVAFISGGKGNCIIERANNLNVKHCFLEVKNKKEILKNLQTKLNFSPNQTAYLGDDLNDISVKNIAAIMIAPSDSTEAFKKKCDLILRNPGGKGAFREFTDKLLLSRNNSSIFTKNGWFETN